MGLSSSNLTEPKIAPAAIARFTDVVFGYLEGLVPVRAFSEKGTDHKPSIIEFHGPDRLADALIKMAPAAAGYARGLYVVPATVIQPGRARAEDVHQTGVVVVDIDDGHVEEAALLAARHLGRPSLDVASGGTTDRGDVKRHLYWRLSEAAAGEDLERVRVLRETLAVKLNADTSFKSMHQPIRVPGTIHGKHGVQSEVRILADSGIEYDLDDLEAAIADMPPIARPTAALAATGHTLHDEIKVADLLARPVRENCADGISRFKAVSKVIGHWIRCARTGKCSPEEAWASVQDYNAALIRPPWPEERLRRDFDALLKRDRANNGSMPTKAETVQEQPAATPNSDDALALEFVRQHGRDWRHSLVFGAWYAWKEGKWERDDVGRVRELMRRVCRHAAETAQSPAEARRISSDKTISAALRIAATDGRIATRPSEWDAHPILLNTPAGIIDLQTGEITDHDRDLLITQMTSASPGGDCPRWKTFLNEITDGDIDLQEYLARLAGYCLTGSTGEQVFAFLHGSGANGKSVFLNMIATILGDYSATSTNDTFMASRSDRHLTELAGLRAARLVIVSETEPGRAWAESRIKSVTGGENIRANFMRQDHFEFRPQFKLLVGGNHRPALNGVGEAMRRRLHLVPFEVTIPPGKRDRALSEKLLAERDGILAWMIAGCAEWQRTGLAPPQSVQAAADAYFEEEDIFGQWLEECCDVDPEHRSLARPLYQNWSAWAEQAGHPAGSQKSLGTALRERGFAAGKVHGRRAWIGIRPRHGATDRGDAE